MIFVLSKVFPDRDVLYWSSGNFAWGCLSSASVYSEDEQKSFKRIPTEAEPDRAEYVNRHTNKPEFIPGDGDWVALPDMIRLMTVDEWVNTL